MKKHRLLSALLGALVAIHAASAQETNSAASDSGGAGGTPQNYRLAPNDLVYVKVFQEDDLNSTLRISEDGSVIFPLIGSVKIGGLTVQTATKTMRDLLDARFLVNPQITMTVLGYANRNVTVLGQVQKPGSYSLRDQGSIGLMQAIGLAGGFTRLANTGKVTVKRTVEGRQIVQVLDGKRMAGDSGTASFAVLPGDTITVAERIF